MTLSCPHCGYARELAPDQAPTVPVRVTCPQCKEQFRFEPQRFPAAAAPSLQPVPAGPEATDSPPEGARALPKAGFWVRLVAAAVDSLLVVMLQVILGLVLLFTSLGLGGDLGIGALAMGTFISWTFGTVLAVAYYVGFTGYCGQTPGKMAVRVKVIRADGAEIGFGRALLRETLGKFISGVILCIGYLMIAFDQQKQGLHDKIADTYVIKL